MWLRLAYGVTLVMKLACGLAGRCFLSKVPAGI